MKSTPVICGIDLGSWSFKICAFNGQKFQVLTNEANFRQTPSLVAYTPTERLIGQAALIKLKTNYNNTIRAPQRLLGLSRDAHLLEEQLRYEKLQYHAQKDLVFSVQGRNGTIQVTVEEVLISLLGKAKNIMDTHQLALSIAYISVPTYYTQQKREGIIKCAELAFRKPVRLVDDWICLAAQYTYNKLKEIKSLAEMKHVVFLDIGYSKVMISLVQFTRYEGRLLDWSQLPYTGCKNMDQNVCQFYDSIFEKQSKQSVLTNSKAFIKLLDAVQKQRTVLSANNEYHLNLQYLLGEEDLAYNMRRQEYQTIVVPILADIASAMAALQSRNSSIPIHAVELMGGASRIPCIQAMASKIFGIEPSRSLNQSQSIAVGCTIFGALERKLINFDFSYDTLSTKQIGVRWGKEKRIIFTKKSKINSQNTINIGPQGVVKMQVFIELGVIQKKIGQLSFKTPNKIIFTLDENKIISAKLSLHQFEIYDFYSKSEQHWKQIIERQEEMSKLDIKMGLIYEMKNNYEATVYSCKNKLAQNKHFATKEQIQQIQKQIYVAQCWIEQQHSKSTLSQADFIRYQQKNAEITVLKNYCDQLDSKNKHAVHLKEMYEQLSQQICAALQRNLSEKSRNRVMEVLSWGQEAYQTMQSSKWSGDDLSVSKLQQAMVMVQSSVGQG